MSSDEQARAREFLAEALRENGQDASAKAMMMDSEWPWVIPARVALRAITEALRGASGGGMDAKVGEGALLPCPFCGGPAEIQLDRGRNVVGVGCQKCVACQVPSWSEEKWAIAAWNTRAPDHPAENATSSGEVVAGSGVAAIAAERRRQVEQEGWTPEHDDEHSGSEMAAAAAAYAFSAATYERYFAADPMGFWPWDASWWKPKGPREDLVRAGALIAAEIDRLDRAALARSGKGEG